MSELSPPFQSQLPRRQLAIQIGAATLGRFCLNVAHRFVYPFAPALSRGLGVPVTAITSLIAINQATGLLSPLFGPLSDRFGYRIMMLFGLSLVTLGVFAAGFIPFYVVILLTLFLTGLGRSIFNPALQAYVGEHIPFQRRGLVIGVIEFTWAGSYLIGMPLVGWLIERWNWQAPFLALGGLGLFSLLVLGIFIPARGRSSAMAASPIGFKSAWRQVRTNRTALGSLGFGFCMNFANDNIFVILGLWLESFGLTLTALGLAASVIGVAELFGEVLTASVSDRLGVKRSLIIGTVLTIVGYLSLPWLGASLTTALIGLFTLFLFFEFTIVTGVSLFTEVLPEARATMLSAYIASAGLGRMSGAIVGGFVWSIGGLGAVSLTATIICTVGLISLLWGVRYWQH